MPKARTAPFRPRTAKGQISQSYNDGMVRIYNVTDVSAAGLKPSEGLELAVTLPYAEKKLGISRYYSAKQNQIEVERVLRVPAACAMNNQQVAICENGQKYRIDLVQLAEGIYPKSYDLTLAKITQNFAGTREVGI